MINNQSFLDKIIQFKKERIRQQLSKDPNLHEIKEKANEASLPLSLFNALNNYPYLSVIAEIKRASPSKGIIKSGLNPIKQGKEYQKFGASAISVITEEDFFNGHPEDLKKVRDNCSLPILRKDFIIHEYQIFESRYLGADAILLIAAILSESELVNFVYLAHEIGLDTVVEVHKINEIPNALKSKTRIIGINNRDLVTFKVDIDTTCQLAKHIPKDRLIISESGIKGRKEAISAAACGARAILVGEALVTATNIKDTLKPLTLIRCEPE